MLLRSSYKKSAFLFLCLSSHALASFSQSRNLSLEVPEYLGTIHEGDLLEGENLFHSFRQELENVLCHLVRRTRHIAKLEQKEISYVDFPDPLDHDRNMNYYLEDDEVATLILDCFARCCMNLCLWTERKVDICCKEREALKETHSSITESHQRLMELVSRHFSMEEKKHLAIVKPKEELDMVYKACQEQRSLEGLKHDVRRYIHKATIFCISIVSIKRKLSKDHHSNSDFDSRHESVVSQLTEIEPHFRCPISYTLMKDPVYFSENAGNSIRHVYERESLTHWIQLRKKQRLPVTDPLTGVVLRNPERLSIDFDRVRDLQEYVRLHSP